MHLTVILVVQLNWDNRCEANETKYIFQLIVQVAYEVFNNNVAETDICFD